MSEFYEQYIMEPILRKTSFDLEIAFRMYALEISKYENFNIQYILLCRTWSQWNIKLLKFDNFYFTHVILRKKIKMCMPYCSLIFSPSE